MFALKLVIGFILAVIIIKMLYKVVNDLMIEIAVDYYKINKNRQKI